MKYFKDAFIELAVMAQYQDKGLGGAVRIFTSVYGDTMVNVACNGLVTIDTPELTAIVDTTLGRVFLDSDSDIRLY